MIETFIKKYLDGVSCKNILDVGPGYSNFARVSAKVTGATKITYIDCNSSVLKWQIDECKKISLEAEPIQLSLDIDDLSKINGYYDLIQCQEILEHLPNAEEVLLSISKHLSKNGLCLITVPTKKSERWLKFINPAYMTKGSNVHVRQFDESDLKKILTVAGLSPIVFIPTQPHYFVSHTWLFGMRIAIDGSTGRVQAKGIRVKLWYLITVFSKIFFQITNIEFWGRLLPRNYFIIAKRKNEL